jgi:hypothetical protein
VDPPEWVPVRDNFIPAPIWGVLFEAKHASGDNPFTHRQWFQPCPVPVVEELVPWVILLGPTALLIVEALRSESICPADWDLKIRPLPGFRSMQAVNRDMVQVEFEREDWGALAGAYGDPVPGELIFAAGRYVVDCGHRPFKTEIHPPFVYTAVTMVTHDGRPATQADIWVTKFFPGGDSPTEAVEFDIFPPPRPSPQALLGARTPGDQDAAVKVTFKSLGPFGPVRVRVTGTRGKPEVTKFGEMKPRNDLTSGFDGRLQVFWNCPAGTNCQ